MPKDNYEVLEELVKMTARELYVIVHERRELIRENDRENFPGPWEEVHSLIEKGMEQIKQTDLKSFEAVGLAGEQLTWKDKMLRSAVGSGIVGRILRRLNSFLGSLSKVIPVFEVVKEYKEQVESSIEDLNAER